MIKKLTIIGLLSLLVLPTSHAQQRSINPLIVGAGIAGIAGLTAALYLPISYQRKLKALAPAQQELANWEIAKTKIDDYLENEKLILDDNEIYHPTNGIFSLMKTWPNYDFDTSNPTYDDCSKKPCQERYKEEFREGCFRYRITQKDFEKNLKIEHGRPIMPSMSNFNPTFLNFTGILPYSFLANFTLKQYEMSQKKAQVQIDEDRIKHGRRRMIGGTAIGIVVATTAAATIFLSSRKK